MRYLSGCLALGTGSVFLWKVSEFRSGGDIEAGISAVIALVFTFGIVLGMQLEGMEDRIKKGQEQR